LPGLRRRTLTAIGVLLLAVLGSLLLAGMIGSVALPVGQLPAAMLELLHGQPSGLGATLLELRLGRACNAFVIGASLALAGVMMQALLRNPLADPYTLGISGGAAVGALLAMLLAGALWVIDAAAFAGAVAISMLLYGFARRDLRAGLAPDGSASVLLLTGVILSSGCMAVVTLILSVAPEGSLRGMVFWMIGDLSGGQVRVMPWLVLSGALCFALRVARAMNVMALHAEGAVTLGIRVGALRRGLFFCSALLTASAVTGAGSIGFVGLIVPHACRFALGPDHRLLLPAACLAGGAFLVLADTLARSVLAPLQLPVGVVTSLIGVPIFLFQLHQLRRR
jgi:iron complex transport system permease protein